VAVSIGAARRANAPLILARRAWAARAAIAAFAAAGWAGIDFGRLAFGARDFEARCLVDDLHRQACLAATIKAELPGPVVKRKLLAWRERSARHVGFAEGPRAMGFRAWPGSEPRSWLRPAGRTWPLGPRAQAAHRGGVKKRQWRLPADRYLHGVAARDPNAAA
jgi:hypothetical protein